MIQSKGVRDLIIYKAAVTNIIDGKSIGTAVLVNDYKTIKGAIKAAEALRLNDDAIVEVRSYDLRVSGMMVWDDPELDAGTTVYHSNSVK